MPDQKTEPRLSVDLPVRMWGMNAEGRPFSQSARAQNISSEGALISGVETELKVGDVVGVKLVADQDCPWKHFLPIDGATVAIADCNRRRFHRHKITLPLELRDQRSNAPLRINATDVSGNGCYVESMQPLPLGTVLRVDLWLDAEHVKVTAIVRTCDPGVGNGIEFTGMTPDTKQRMQTYLDAIDPQMGVA